jgi:hemoglobin-like flavoprotein
VRNWQLDQRISIESTDVNVARLVHSGWSGRHARQTRHIHLEVCCLTPEQKVLVQQSFALVEPIADTAAELFYARLFELDPSLRALFSGDLREQGRKLMQMIAVAVRGLDHLETIVPAVQALGRRHVAYGVKPEHFVTVGMALIWTLQQGLGSAFTPEVREAWSTVFGVLATTMQVGET